MVQRPGPWSVPSGPVTVTACGPCGDPSGQRSAVSRWPPTACPLDPLELYGLWVPTCGLLPPPSAHCRLLPQVCTRGSRPCVCTPDTPSSGLHCKGPVASGREGGPARGSGQAPADRTLPPAHVPAVPGTCWIMPGPGSPGPHLEPARPALPPHLHAVAAPLRRHHKAAEGRAAWNSGVLGVSGAPTGTGFAAPWGRGPAREHRGHGHG